MRKVVLQEWLSVDGLAAGPNDSVDFVPAATRGDEGFIRDRSAFLESIDTIVLGRVTYEMFSRFWPQVTEGEEKPYADKLNATRKVVFSRTLARAPWGEWPEATVVRDDPAGEVAALKRESGKDVVVCGSLSLAQALSSANVVDEDRLVICPVLLGNGRPLLRDDRRSELVLVEAKAFDRGAVSLRYHAGR